MAELTIALAGNPNAGKSTIFNHLTGLRQHTGNWPGKTVEKKSGLCYFQNQTIELVDLPGTYSLSAYSPDEIVARDFITLHHPDAVICVLDATNLERNLYLAVQVLELGVPVVVALNMIDQARSTGIEIDTRQLAAILGAPVVATVASRGEGIDQLLAVTLEVAQAPVCAHCHCDLPHSFRVDYGEMIEGALQQVETAVRQSHLSLNGYCPRWLSLKLLEGEADIVQRVATLPEGGAILLSAVQQQAHQLQTNLGDDVDILTADHRYAAVSQISQQAIKMGGDGRLTITDRIDRIATHRLLGLPIFLLVMYIVFRLVIDVSAPFLEWVDGVINGPIARLLQEILSGLTAPAWAQSLLIDGVLAGVGGILVFVPGLMVLYFFLALLEDSGYMARAAFVMDRFMRVIGLHGKSVIPLMLGFGCAVPAIYATRTIANRRDRLLTALLIPFMSCSARLPVYVVFAMAFFAAHAGTVIWLMYVVGLVVAVLLGFVLSRTLLRPELGTAFVLELPSYRRPTLKSLLLHTWENTREFVKKAGTVILAMSVVLWLLLNLPLGVTEQRESLYGRFSATLAPALAPAGFGEWETAGALVTGFIAKEMVVSTLAQIYTGEAPAPELATQSWGAELTGVVVGFGQAAVDAAKTMVSLLPGVNLTDEGEVVEDTLLTKALQERFTPLSAIAFLVFVLLYVPCVATIGAIRQEFGGRWALSAAVYQTFIAWALAVATYQIGTIF